MPCVKQVLLSALKPIGEADTRLRPTKGHQSPKLSYPSPLLPTQISRPSTQLKAMVCSLVGPPGAIASAGPLILGMRWEGQSRGPGTVLGTKLWLHLGKSILSYPPFLFCPFTCKCILLLLSFSLSLDLSLSLMPSLPPLRHCTDLLSFIHSQHRPLWEPGSLSPSLISFFGSSRVVSLHWTPKGHHVQRRVKVLGKAGLVG